MRYNDEVAPVHRTPGEYQHATWGEVMRLVLKLAKVETQWWIGFPFRRIHRWILQRDIRRLTEQPTRRKLHRF